MKKTRKPNPSKTDKDNPAWTAEDFRKARSARDVVPQLVAAYERTRGRPVGRKKEVISISVDKDVLAALRRSGAGWQTRVNDLLKAAVGVTA